MKRILFPTDLTEEANHAVRFAAKLCQRVGAHLTIFNVQSVWSMTVPELLLGKALTVQVVQEHLKQLSEEISSVFKISCSGTVLEANRSIPQSIAEAGEEHLLIIMTVRKPEDVFDAIAGSTAYQVSKESAVPLLLLPPGCEYNEMEQLVFAADYLTDKTLPFGQLAAWADLLKLKVTILQVITTPYHHDTDTALQALQSRLRNELPPGMECRFCTQYDDTVISGIAAYVEQNEVDAIALSTRHHTLLANLFHKSVIKQMSTATRFPMFVFHH